jgi:hypothetical protein
MNLAHILHGLDNYSNGLLPGVEVELNPPVIGEDLNATASRGPSRPALLDPPDMMLAKNSQLAEARRFVCGRIAVPADVAAVERRDCATGAGRFAQPFDMSQRLNELEAAVGGDPVAAWIKRSTGSFALVNRPLRSVGDRREGLRPVFDDEDRPHREVPGAERWVLAIGAGHAV